MVYIYTVSDKALMGKQINILSSYIAESFFKNNIKTSKQSIISDAYNFDELLKQDNTSNSIKIFLVDRANIKLNQCICDFTNSKIIDNPYTKNAVFDYYRKIGQPVEKESENEWKISSVARAIINPIGITQGYLLNHKTEIICVLPNSYEDARLMFDDVVLDYILSLQKKKYKSYTFKTFGLTENGINSVINEQIKNKDKVSINLFSKPLEVDIVIKAFEDNQEIDNIAQKILLKLDKYIYSVEDIPIEKVVYNLLKLNDIKVSFVEDVTCGELCSRLNKQSSDAKNYIERSFVLPDNQSKILSLGIRENELQENFGISPNLVYEMAVKGIEKSNASIVVATLGVVNQNPNLPTGLSYIAVGDKKEIHVYKNLFKGNFNEIVESITIASYFYLIKKLKKNDFHFEKSTI